MGIPGSAVAIGGDVADAASLAFSTVFNTCTVLYPGTVSAGPARRDFIPAKIIDSDDYLDFTGDIGSTTPVR